MTDEAKTTPKTKTKDRKSPNRVRSLGRLLESYLSDNSIAPTVPVGDVLASVKEDAWILDS